MHRCRKCNRQFTKILSLKIHLLRHDIKELRRELRQIKKQVEETRDIKV